MEILQNFAKFKFLRFLQNLNFATFSKNQLDSFVDLEKPEKMSIQGYTAQSSKGKKLKAS